MKNCMMEGDRRILAGTMRKRIGYTTYLVRVYADEAATETVEEKIARLIKNEVVTGGTICGNIDIPQTRQPPERGPT